MEMIGLAQEYSEARQKMLAESERLFPAGCRVRPPGVKTGNWSGTVGPLSEYERRATSADMVFVHWDNGNKYAVSVSELERTI